jgi:hypothetical protein
MLIPQDLTLIHPALASLPRSTPEDETGFFSRFACLPCDALLAAPTDEDDEEDELDPEDAEDDPDEEEEEEEEDEDDYEDEDDDEEDDDETIEDDEQDEEDEDEDDEEDEEYDPDSDSTHFFLQRSVPRRATGWSSRLLRFPFHNFRPTLHLSLA